MSYASNAIADPLYRYNKRLETENDKLREFASELMNHWKSATSRGCLLCERECDCQGEDCYYDMKAEELGIEASE